MTWSKAFGNTQRPAKLNPLIGAALLAMGTLVGPSQARAASVSTCSLEFQVKGTDIQILVGYSRLRGIGSVSCIDASGKQTSLPVKVTVGTPILFPRVSFAPSLVVRGAATGIQILDKGPEALRGKYLTLDIRVALGQGAASILQLESEDGGTVIQLGLHDVEGFGLAVGGTIVTIE